MKAKKKMAAKKLVKKAIIKKKATGGTGPKGKATPGLGKSKNAGMKKKFSSIKF